MKVLLTGGSGFLGGHVLRACVDAGHEVRVLLRPRSQTELIRELLDSDQVEQVTGDVTDSDSVDRAIAGCDAVIHCAGFIGLRPQDVELMRAVQVGGARTVLAACRRASVRRVVYTSTATLAGVSDRPGRIFGDGDSLRPDATPIAYVRTKSEAEELFLRAGEDGTECMVLAPGCLLGPGDHYISSTDLVLRSLRGEIPVYLDGGFNFVDVRDVAGAHVAALERGTPGRRLLLPGENLSIDGLFGLLAEIADVKRPKHKLPRALGMVTGFVAEALAKGEAVTRDAIRMATLYNFVDSKVAARELGFAPRTTRESLADTVRWLRDRGYASMPAAELRRIRHT